MVRGECSRAGPASSLVQASRNSPYHHDREFKLQAGTKKLRCDAGWGWLAEPPKQNAESSGQQERRFTNEPAFLQVSLSAHLLQFHRPVRIIQELLPGRIPLVGQADVD